MPQPMPGYFFTPQHIALIGASERAESLGERILTSLLGSSFQGSVTPVNLRHKTVAGIKAYTSLSKIPAEADLVIAVTPPESYELLFKACLKQKLHHIILIQEWERLSEESWQAAQNLLNRYRATALSISACHPSGFQLPTQGLNAGIMPDFPAGHVALLSGDDILSCETAAMLGQMKQGLSRHLSLNFELSPTSCADWINRFGHNRHTRLAILHYNPLENQRKLFSAIRHFARHTPVILHCTHAVNELDCAVLQSLSRHSNFLLTFSSSDLQAALHAGLSNLKPISELTVFANRNIGFLNRIAQQHSISLNMPSEKPAVSQGNLGSTPSPMFYRSKIADSLQSDRTQAVLSVISPHPNISEQAYAKVLKNLRRSTDKPLLISSRFSDGLLHFEQPEQALQTLAFSNRRHELQQEKNRIAAPHSAAVRTPNAAKTADTITAQNWTQLAKQLYLPTYSENQDNGIKLTAHRHTLYGLVASINHQGKIFAVLPPFSTLDAEDIVRFASLQPNARPVIEQFLHSLNALGGQSDLLDTAELSIQPERIRSRFTPSEKQAAKPTAIPVSAPARLKRSSTEMLSHLHVAKLLGHKNTSIQTHTKRQNVRAPYPTISSDSFTLKNGLRVRIRAFQPEDAEAKQQFVRQLSPQARYTRFMAATNELPPPTLARFSRLDYQAEAAFIAENSDGIILGVSRFSRISREECEFGITVAESARGSGLATVLMQTIIEYATQTGYRSINAEILKKNAAMLKLAEKSGFTLTLSEQDKNLYLAKRNLLPAEQSGKADFPQ